MTGNDKPKPPPGLRWRSSTPFILSTVAIGLFSDLFLYGLAVPVLPFVLSERVGVAPDDVQFISSLLLTIYAAASLVFCPVVGIIADRMESRRVPYMIGLLLLLAATALLCFGRTLWLLIVARILQGASGAVVWCLGLTITQDTVGSADLGKTIGSIFSVISVGELLAPTLGGIINKFSYYGVYGLGAGVLVVDIVVRLLVLEKSVARRYGLVDNPPPSPSPTPRSSDDDPITERTPLTARQSTASSLPLADPSRSTNPLVRAFPFVRAMSNPRLLASFFVAFNQATLLAAFDATIPIHAQDIFGFDSLKAGALFAALDLPYLICGPIMGWLVDRRGPRLMATIGGVYLVPTLILLRIPHRIAAGESQTVQVAVYSILLGLNGIGMSILSSPSLVDASAVVEEEGKEHPERYGGKAPFGQLYAVYSAVFSLGLSVGPILAGMLSDAAGYGNSMLVMALLAGSTAIVSFIFMGKR